MGLELLQHTCSCSFFSFIWPKLYSPWSTRLFRTWHGTDCCLLKSKLLPAASLTLDNVNVSCQEFWPWETSLPYEVCLTVTERRGNGPYLASSALQQVFWVLFNKGNFSGFCDHYIWCLCIVTYKSNMDAHCWLQYIQNQKCFTNPQEEIVDCHSAPILRDPIRKKHK